ncbi:MAG: hypothetical protein E7B11_26860 [Clostridiales bacterium]|nr:hypothetical protein [Clostridiales bacterium]
MEKKKIILCGACVLLLIISIVLGIFLTNKSKGRDEKKQPETAGVQNETESMKVAETGKQPETDLETEEQTKTETKKQKAVIFQVDSLAGFLSADQVEEVQNRVLSLMPEESGNEKLCVVKCMTYQEVSVEKMNVTFYLIDSTDQVYEGHYNFSTAQLSIEASSRTKEELEELAKKEQERVIESEQKEQEAVTKRLESERVAESERIAESEKKAAKEKKESEKAEKKKKESEEQAAKEAETYKTTVD